MTATPGNATMMTPWPTCGTTVAEPKPRLLDLFCGAGGAAMGYHRAGFDVVGVDIAPQPHYPFEFHQADALEWVSDPGLVARSFDAIHASPPCQAYSAGKNMWHGRLPDDRHPDLVAPTRQALIAAGLPWVIENVVGAPLLDPITLCGDSFGLGVKRHRLFESSLILWNPPTCRAPHPLFVVSVFGGGALSRTPPLGSRDNFMQRRNHVAHAEAQIHMGIDWMTRDELSQAIPPAYTEWIGAQLLAAVERAA
jgi:DNA (cytosine-5)-methyltransferase 1